MPKDRIYYPSEGALVNAMRGISKKLPDSRRVPLKISLNLHTSAWRVVPSGTIKVPEGIVAVRSSIARNSDHYRVARTILRNLHTKVEITRIRSGSSLQTIPRGRAGRPSSVCTKVLPSRDELKKRLRALSADSGRRFASIPEGAIPSMGVYSVMVAALDLTVKPNTDSPDRPLLEFYSEWRWREASSGPDFRRVYLTCMFTISLSSDFSELATEIRKKLCVGLQDYKANYEAGIPLIGKDHHGRVSYEFSARKPAEAKPQDSLRSSSGPKPVELGKFIPIEEI